MAPHAAMELGLTHLSVEQFSEARLWLDKARRDYTGYLLETIVHFRVHCAMRIIKPKLQLPINTCEESSPLPSPDVDNDLNTSFNSRISSVFMEFSKKMSLVSFNQTTEQNRTAEYEDFLDGYRTKL